ncbi:MAG TPA: peptidyl-prolyl cis-trans isomerase [Thermodesulfobacteriota bacterium]|nr:peptidyl-prolyl cis-trans isomerase [Thermodesulfobacteriota bacterium]
MRKMQVLFVIFAFVASACGSAPGSGPRGEVLAVVDGEPITKATLLKEVENLPPYVRPILETAAGRAQFLESVITRDLLMREALRRGVDRRPEVADRIAMARKSIVLEALLRDVAGKAPGLSDAALRKIYDANPALHQVGERVRVSHMLFRDKARALEFLGRAKAGEPFEALMKEVKAENGKGEVAADLGEIERGNFVKEFEAAAFAAAPGEVIGPVKTTYGYHVIKVYAKLPAGVRSFEDVKPKLLEEQREQAQRDAFEGLIAGLRKQATVRVLYKPEGPPVSPESQAPGTAPVAPNAGTPDPPPPGK